MPDQAPPTDWVDDCEAESLRRAVTRWRFAEAEWIDAMLDLAEKLFEARQRFPRNTEFGVWLDRNGIDLNKDDRSALIRLAKEKVTASAVRETECRSPHHIWIALRVSSTAVEDRDSWKAHWTGMPDFEQQDLSPVKSITVHFRSAEDMRDFSERMGQKITMETRSIWHPAAEIARCADKAYVYEPEAEARDEL